MPDAPRQTTFVLARPEARVLEWIARHLPAGVLPDHLTLLALAASGIVGSFVRERGLTPFLRPC